MTNFHESGRSCFHACFDQLIHRIKSMQCKGVQWRHAEIVIIISAHFRDMGKLGEGHLSWGCAASSAAVARLSAQLGSLWSSCGQRAAKSLE